MNEITSYQDIEEIAYGRELPLMGTNADGECVLLSFGRTTADGTTMPEFKPCVYRHISRGNNRIMLICEFSFFEPISSFPHFSM